MSMKKFDNASIGNAVIWVATIFASAVILRGTQYATPMLVILGGAAGASVLLVEGTLHKR
jgi:hypothetical protein